MKSLFLMLLLVLPCVAQEVPKSPPEVPAQQKECFHEDEDEFYASLEHSPPMRIVTVDGKTIFLNRITKYRNINLTLTMHLDTTRFPPTMWKHENRRFQVIYCRKHLFVYVVGEVPKK